MNVIRSADALSAGSATPHSAQLYSLWLPSMPAAEIRRRDSALRAAPPELRPHEIAGGPGSTLLLLRLLLDGDVTGPAAIGEGKAFGNQGRTDILAVDEAHRELARVPVDEFLVDLAAEARLRHQLLEAVGRDGAAIPDAALAIAAGLQALERIDAEKPQPLCRAAQPEMGEQAFARHDLKRVAVIDAVAVGAHGHRQDEHDQGRQHEQPRRPQRAEFPPPLDGESHGRHVRCSILVRP